MRSALGLSRARQWAALLLDRESGAATRAKLVVVAPQHQTATRRSWSSSSKARNETPRDPQPPLPPTPPSRSSYSASSAFSRASELFRSKLNMIKDVNFSEMNPSHPFEKGFHIAETMIMDRISDSGTRRFRAVFVASIIGLVVTTGLYGDDIRKGLANNIAGIAKETLENESLRIQTQELAAAVVQTVLNDKDIATHATAFFKDVSAAPETQQALVDLAYHILIHPQTVEVAGKLVKQLLANLALDQEVIAKLAGICVDVFAVPSFKAALVDLVNDLCEDPEVIQGVQEMMVKVLSAAPVAEQTLDVLQKSSVQVLDDDELKSQSRAFLTNVMGDDLLQREGGEALWNSILYALQPGAIKAAGACIVALSIAAIRVFLVPF